MSDGKNYDFGLEASVDRASAEHATELGHTRAWVFSRAYDGHLVAECGTIICLRIPLPDSPAYSARLEKNLLRSIACVNALAGVADPAAAIEAARVALRMAKSVTMSYAAPGGAALITMRAIDTALAALGTTEGGA